MTGQKKMIYNGSKNPNLLQYMALNLTPGAPYGFSVIAFNFNGPSIESNVAQFKPCVEPSGISPPTIYSSTKMSISFNWKQPEKNGECPITGYRLYIDDGNNGPFTAVDDDEIANKDYLRQHTVSFANTD